ncbi:MAG: O-antigen ligase family protein [Patescibacteria group bacterium]
MFNKINKIIEYLLYLLVFLLPLQTRWIIKLGNMEYSTYSLYWTDIILVFILLLFIILKLSTYPLPTTNYQLPAWRLIFGLVLISAVSVFFSSDKLLALYKFSWLILGVGLFWLIISANYNRLKLIYVFLAGIFLQAVLGIWQFLTQSTFSNKWLGLAQHNSTDLGTSVIEVTKIGERWLRAYGGLDHPNMLGGLLVIGILILIVEIIKINMNDKFLIFDFKFLNNIKFFKIILWLLLLIFTMALFFSFSRAAWLGLIIGLVSATTLTIFNRNLLQQKQLIKIILIMGILLFILFNQCQNLVIARISNSDRLEIKSTTERLVSYQNSWEVIKQNWFTGVGIGNYVLILRNKNFINQANYNYQPAHNTFLLICAEVGIIGVIFFIGILIHLIILNFFRLLNLNQSQDSDEYRENFQYLIFKNKIKDFNIECLFNLMILFSLIILLNFDHWWWSLHFGILFFWLIVGIIYKRLNCYFSCG